MRDVTIKLFGRLHVEFDGRRVDQELRGRQGRLLFAYLVLNRSRSIARDELLGVVWPTASPANPDAALSTMLSRLRSVLREGLVADRDEIALRLPVDASIDVEHARAALDRARGSLASNAWPAAREAAQATIAATQQRLLSGLEAPWVEAARRELEEVRLEALETLVLADRGLGDRELPAAERAARAIVELAPLRESGHLALMEVQEARGNHAEALQSYERMRRTLDDELGAVPSERARRIHARLLGGEDPVARQSPPPDATQLLPTPPVQAPQLPDARRLVSVLAARAGVGDPEALHGLFARCALVIERHGGSVERYLGDAIVGLFGLAESHDDDALRATRAAAELCGATSGLSLGIESGEVFLGAGPRGATIATGAAITAAGRLAERAAPGEIVLGPQIRLAVGASASIDESTGRLIELHVERPALLRAPSTPFVGRARELDELRDAFARACDEGSCQMITIVGPPGIGKSRLAGEFLAAIGDDAAVLAGRCLAYGEGTTYRALADIVLGLADHPRERVEELLAGDEQAIRGILAAIGLSEEPAQVEETAWALRLLLERLATQRPLVVAVEDIHWADPALLDVLDHVAALSSGSPILLICLTRPELLQSRPQWVAPQPNRSVLVLDALADVDARELAELLGAHELAEPIARRAEGNPLFVEQLVAVDAGADERELPVSIQAVLSARIDRLEGEQRMLLRRAAVEGRTFHAGPLGPRVSAQLVALARSGLIAADRPEYPGEQAFRFTHALIREAAYAGLPKLLRAELHARIADWLEQRPAAPDEIVAYHLEQTCRLAGELGSGGAREHALGTRAVARFQAASRAALGRGDPGSASVLLERAVALVASDEPARVTLLPALGSTLFQAGRMTEATAVLDEAIAQTRDPRVRARAQVEREFVRLETETSVGTTGSQSVADAVMPLLERERDEQGQGRAWSLRAHVAWAAGHVGPADDAWREAARCAKHAGDERELFEILAWRATAAVLGPTPVGEAIRRCGAFRDLVASSPVALAWMINPLASLHAMNGDFHLADRLLLEAHQTLHQLGSVGASVPHHAALVRLLAGTPELAEATLRAGVETLSEMSAEGVLATTTAMLAQAVYEQGRMSEAGELCQQAADAAASDDIVTQVIWRGVQAKVLAHEGDGAQAEALAREAIALVAPTDLLSHHGDAMLDLAEVLRAAARPAESDDAVRAALALYELKQNAAAAARARSLLTDRRSRER